MQLQASEKKGVESLSKVIELGAKNIALGLKIAEGGVNAQDIAHVPEAFENIKELVLFISEKPELPAEIRDLDPAEGFLLLTKAFQAYQEISKK